MTDEKRNIEGDKEAKTKILQSPAHVIHAHTHTLRQTFPHLLEWTNERSIVRIELLNSHQNKKPSCLFTKVIGPRSGHSLLHKLLQQRRRLRPLHQPRAIATHKIDSSFSTLLSTFLAGEPLRPTPKSKPDCYFGCRII